MKLTDYLAIYGAIVSTLVFAWSVLQSRPRIKVDLIYGIESAGEAIKSGVYIVVRNLSPHEVHLSNISILYPGSIVSLKDRFIHAWRFKRLPRRIGWIHSSLSNYSVESGCPMCLEARKSHQVLIPGALMDEILGKATERSLIACVQDQLWNNVYSYAYKWKETRSTH